MMHSSYYDDVYSLIKADNGNYMYKQTEYVSLRLKIFIFNTVISMLLSDAHVLNVILIFVLFSVGTCSGLKFILLQN